MAFAPDGKTLAAGLTQESSRDHTAVGVWDLANGKRLHRLGGSYGATAVAFSPNGRLVAEANASAFAKEHHPGHHELIGVGQPLLKKRAKHDFSIAPDSSQDPKRLKGLD